MKITVSQLRKIIREEVQKNLTESKFKVGDTGTVVEVGNSPYIKIISHRTGMIGWINGG